MTDETTPVDAPAADPGVQISVEQILASILSLGPVSVPLSNLVANYGGKNIAVNQDPDTKAVTFELADVILPVEEDSSAETENTPAE
jgi:hypothetical protein